MAFEYFDAETELLLASVCECVEQDAEVAKELAKIEQELSEN